MSNNTACDSGTRAAPNMPCTMRNITIWLSVCAMPHSTEATVKPITDVTNKRVRPKRAARNPTGAVMIAAATM